MKSCTFPGSALFADDFADTLELLRHVLVSGNDVIKCVCDLPAQSCPGAWQACRKIAVAHRTKARQNHTQICSRRLSYGNGNSLVLRGLCGSGIRVGCHLVMISLHGSLLKERRRSSHIQKLPVLSTVNISKRIS